MSQSTEAIGENKPPVVFGVCWWNHRTIRGLLEHFPAAPLFCKTFDRALDEAESRRGCLIGWASRVTDDHADACKAADIPLARVEDGFIRSAGLGAGLAPASSLVMDKRGIYYDATQASDLEWMLENVDLDDEQRERGASLRHEILQARVSKYNLGKSPTEGLFPANCRKVLVPGQVADDASILKTRSGSIDLVTAGNINIALLERARRDNPDAHIIYKPHPDVASGLRKGAIDVSDSLKFADQVIEGTDIIDVIDACDKVETLTSLSGFEALLRGKDVVVHGLPFYAGWGLTTDHTHCERRTRRRTIDELVYLTLVKYSLYVNPSTFRRCGPEEVIGALQELRNERFHKISNAVRLQIAWIGDRLNSNT